MIERPSDWPLTVRAYARHRGCSPAAVRKAIKQGRLTEKSITYDNPKGWAQVYPDNADVEWAGNSDPGACRDNAKIGASVSATKRRKAGKKPKLKPAPAGREPGGEPGGEPQEGPTLNEVRRDKESWAVKAARLKYRKDAGELCEVKKVEDEYFRICRITRDAILSVPAKIVAEARAAPTDHAGELLMLQALTEALEALVNGA